MSVTHDWCGHETCGAPIERWSREWKHRDFKLDADHQAIPKPAVGPLEEGLHLRADRYATALAAAVAADERIAALTELLVQHEWYRSQAESVLNLVQEDPQFGTVWAPTGPEPEDVNALLCLLSGAVYYRRHGAGMRDGWRRADVAPGHAAVIYEWPIGEAGPFIAWRDSYGFDLVLREAQRRDVEFNELHRALYSLDGYRHPDASAYGRPVLAEAIQRILQAQLQRIYKANEKAQQATQMLAQLRRAIAHLQPDDTEAEVIDLDKVLALLDRVDCGGEVF